MRHDLMRQVYPEQVCCPLVPAVMVWSPSHRSPYHLNGLLKPQALFHVSAHSHRRYLVASVSHCCAAYERLLMLQRMS